MKLLIYIFLIILVTDVIINVNCNEIFGPKGKGAKGGANGAKGKKHRPKKFTDAELETTDKGTLYETFVKEHGKKWKDNTAEKGKRRKHFDKAVNEIVKRNKNNKGNRHKRFKLEPNFMADLSPEEKKRMMGKKTKQPPRTFMETVKSTKATTSNFLKKKNKVWEPIDWRSHFSTPRDQGMCGGCWAFAMSGVLEGRNSILGKSNEYISPQQLINCEPYSMGCDGGDFPNTLRWFSEGNGVILDKTNPYVGAKDFCNISMNQWTTTVTGNEHCVFYEPNNQCNEQRIYDLLKNGPVLVGIDGNSMDVQYYSSGILSPSDCTESNHAVILVGYGVEDGMEFWIIRNSWSEYWGEDGYVRIEKNVANQNSCFITQEAWAPIVQQ